MINKEAIQEAKEQYKKDMETHDPCSIDATIKEALEQAENSLWQEEKELTNCPDTATIPKE